MNSFRKQDKIESAGNRKATGGLRSIKLTLRNFSFVFVFPLWLNFLSSLLVLFRIIDDRIYNWK